MAHMNAYGLKNSCDMYRTFDGVRYIQWENDFSERRGKAYRSAGVKCRRVLGELFIRESDRTLAQTVYASLEG